jgi:CAAX protease family protein
MKISENSAEELPVPAEQGAIRWPVPPQPIAPWWHTALMVAVILGVSILSSVQARVSALAQQHLKHYAFTMAWEVALAALAWWGIRMRRVPVRQLLGERRVGVKAWFTDFGVALIFWLVASIVLAAIASVLRLLHLMRSQKAVFAIAPQTGWEIVLWVLLSTTAGVVEEFVFRGYLLQQFSSIGGRLWLGVLVSSLLFGAAHGYEGVGAMIAIVAFGAMFCALTIQRRSLRAGMMAHAWHDSLTGILLSIAKHLRVI